MTKSGSQNQGYGYSSLDTSTRCIRLIKLKPGSNDNPIECKLHVAQLDDQCPNFFALSYEWGSEEECRDIVVDGKIISVRKNLWAALHAIRDIKIIATPPKIIGSLRARWKSKLRSDPVPKWCFTTSPNAEPELRGKTVAQFLWIDALCINQDNTTERNHQVNMMGDIFSRATAVAAWLGSRSDSSDLAIEAMKSTDISKANESGKGPSRFDELEAIVGLYGRSYWSRLWIVQELVLARNIIVICESAMLGWDQVQSFSGPLLSSYHRYCGDWKHIEFCNRVVDKSHAMAIIKARAYVQNVCQVEPLDALISRFYNHGCMDPRDRVYGLLGMVSYRDTSKRDGTSTPFPVLRPDYSKSVQEVYDDVISYFTSSRSVSTFYLFFLRHALGIGRTIVNSRSSKLVETES